MGGLMTVCVYAHTYLCKGVCVTVQWVHSSFNDAGGGHVPMVQYCRWSCSVYRAHYQLPLVHT